MRRALATTAAYLGACAVFTGLMAFTTTAREQEAWVIAAALLLLAGLAITIVTAMYRGRP